MPSRTFEIKWGEFFLFEQPMAIHYEWHYGEPPIYYTQNGDGHPGSMPRAEILSVSWRGIEILSKLEEEELDELEAQIYAKEE